jgi:membrane protein DedA with SNARE-associated domain
MMRVLDLPAADDPRASTSSDADAPDEPPAGAPSRRALTLVVVPLIILWIMARIADATFAQLVPSDTQDGNPYLLLVLSPLLRYQVLVVNDVNPVAFFFIGTIRLLLADPPFYLLGRWYGDSAVRWMERQSPGTARFLRRSEGVYGKAAYPLVAIAPNNLICLLAGSSKMRPLTFFVLNISGTMVRLLLIIQFGEAFADQIDVVQDFIGRYRWWIMGISVAAVGAMILSQARSGTGEIAQLRQLEDELEREHTRGEHTPGTSGAGDPGQEDR